MGNKYSLTFGGDTSLGDYYVRTEAVQSVKKRLAKDPVSFFDGVRPVIEGSSHVILNLETVLANNPVKIHKNKRCLNYDAPGRTLKVLRELGVTAVCFANNHSMDFGPDIMLRTINHLKAAGISCFGAGPDLRHAAAPLKIKLEGKEVDKAVYILAGLRASNRYQEEFGFFAGRKRPGVCPLEADSLKERVSQLRAKEPESIVIVSPHWQGCDYKGLNTAARNLCRDIVDAGANYVLAHGTHTLNSLERRDKGIIAFSIGNFVFNSAGRYQKKNAPPYSFIVRIEITENEGAWSMEERFYPTLTDNLLTNYNSRPVDENEAEEIQQLLNRQSSLPSTLSLRQDKRGFYFVINAN